MSDNQRVMGIESPTDISLLLVEARLAKGMSQQEAADYADAFRPYISRMENDDFSFTYLERMFTLLRKYGVTLTASFDEPEEEKE